MRKRRVKDRFSDLSFTLFVFVNVYFSCSAIYFLIAEKLSALIACSTLQASSEATSGSTPMEVSHPVRKVCRS